MEAGEPLGRPGPSPGVDAAHIAAIVWHERRGMRLMRGSAPPRPLSRRLTRSVLASLAVMGVAVSAACGGPSKPSSSPNELTVWVDAVRLPVAEAYAKAHPNLHVNIVTYDGD